MKKRRLFLLISIFVLMVVLLSIFFSFCLVVFVYPESFGEYYSRFNHPQTINSGYISIVRRGEERSLLEKIKGVDLYVYAPLSTLSDEIVTSYFLINNKEGSAIKVEKKPLEMWSSILSSFPDRAFVALYQKEDDESSSLLETLTSEFPNLDTLSYSDRVSVVNKEEIVKTLDSYYGVLALTPESSRDALRSTKAKVVVDEIYAASLLSLDSLISLHYDWDRIIREYLRDGDISIYYTFSVIH